jgi:hypothetical protein
MTDTMGLIWGVVVHAADVSERDGARMLLTKILKKWRRIKTILKILADGGYSKYD